jgi:CRISPR-associated protein Csb2
VFMAIAAAYFETRGDEEERAVLEWLENAGPPAIHAGKFFVRSDTRRYVPVNDTLELAAVPHAVPRSRQSRSFPTVRLDDPFVYLNWTSSIPSHLIAALERLCAKVTRIGHSSSLVNVWVAKEPVNSAISWEPSDQHSDMRMRIAGSGTLRYLETSFSAKKLEDYSVLADRLDSATAKERTEVKRQIAQRFPQGAPKAVRPILNRWQGYREVATKEEQQEAAAGPFEPEMIVLRRIIRPDGAEVDAGSLKRQRIFGLEATLQLTSTLRDAAMKAVGENVPEWLSGHAPDGKPSLNPHAAFLPLPFVGSKYSDGHIMGLAIAIPRHVDAPGETEEETRRRVLGALLFRNDGEDKTIRLWRASTDPWEWELQRETSDYPPESLRASTWTRPSRHWASVTPVVLHHYPKNKLKGDVERILIEAFASAGLPRPLALRLTPVSSFTGAGHAKSMPEFTEGGRSLCRYQVHVAVQFAQPVRGPVLLGRGRFRGYGLLRPVEVQRG